MIELYKEFRETQKEYLCACNEIEFEQVFQFLMDKLVKVIVATMKEVQEE